MGWISTSLLFKCSLGHSPDANLAVLLIPCGLCGPSNPKGTCAHFYPCRFVGKSGTPKIPWVMVIFARKLAIKLPFCCGICNFRQAHIPTHPYNSIIVLHNIPKFSSPQNSETPKALERHQKLKSAVCSAIPSGNQTWQRTVKPCKGH